MVNDNKKLNSGAKAFVPGGSSVQTPASTWGKQSTKNSKNSGKSEPGPNTNPSTISSINDTAKTETKSPPPPPPTPTTTTNNDTSTSTMAKSKSKQSKSNPKQTKTAPAATPATTTNGKTAKPTTTKPNPTPAATSTPAAPTPAAIPAPAATVVSAWGQKKSSAAIRAAPTSQPPSPVRTKSGGATQSGWRTNNSNNRQTSGGRGSNDQDGGRGGDRDRDGGRGSGGRGRGGGSWRSGGGGGGGKMEKSGDREGGRGGGRRNDNGSNKSGDREGGRGGGRRNPNNNNHDRYNNDRNNNDRNNNSNDNSNEGWKRGKTLPMELCKPGDGDTAAQKKVRRIAVEELLTMRLSYLAPPLSWESEGGTHPGPPQVVRWDSETRMTEIDAMAKLERVAGDVSQQRRGGNKGGKDGRKGGAVDTAPALEDCKPLAVNEETRWKSKVFKEGGGEEGGEGEVDSNEEVLKKSLLILKKLSLTKFDKLSDAFIASGIGRNEECLSSAVVLIVNKAQDEPHFSAMYAQLCLKLAATPMGFEENSSKKGKKFKKMLLTACQAEFEENTDAKIAKAIEGLDDEEEKVYKAGIIKKHYLGHMTFIGELFKGQLISIKIMLFCLPMLLEATSESGIDEEKVECFAKLLSTIGYNLEQESEKLKDKGKNEAANELAKCWKKVEIMAGRRKEKGAKVSNRMKFMMEDLIEMKKNGWVKRRKEETAKTIEEIHKDVRREERQNSSGKHHHGNNNNMRRQSSASEMHNMHRRPATAAPSVDKDGFTQISGGGGSQGSSFSRSQSMNNMQRTHSDRSIASSNKKPSGIGRSSSGSSFAALNEPSSRSRPSSSRGKKVVEEQQQQQHPSQPTTNEETTLTNTYKSPDDCGIKAQNILKEFFVGGDADDAVLSFKELIGAGSEGSVERGAKAVEKAVTLVLEMKQDEVDKFLTLYSRSFTEKEIETPSIIAGLSEPLEFLTDIAIDAPLATNHMVTIISKFLTIGAVSFEFLLETPDYFRTDCGAAAFGCKVLKKMGGDALESTAYLEVIEKLMTDDDRGMFPSAKELLAKWAA